MPGDIPVNNRKLPLCVDQDYCIRFLYFTQAGQEVQEGNL